MDFKQIILGGITGTLVTFLALTGGEVPDVDHIAETPSPCHAGWSYNKPAIEHAPSASCQKGTWVVVLTPDLTFDYGLDTGDKNATPITDPTLVPGW